MKKPRKAALQVIRGTKSQGDLEARVSAILKHKFHRCAQHQDICKRAAADPDSVDQALNSARVRSDLDTAKIAFLVVQTPVLLAQLVQAAKSGEQWAWRVLLDSLGVTEILRASPGEAAAQELAAIASPEFEESFVKNLRELLQEKPHGQAGSEDVPRTGE